MVSYNKLFKMCHIIFRQLNNAGLYVGVKQKMIYEEIVSQFGLKKGDKIWLSSELIQLILTFRTKKIKFDGSALLDEFQRAIGREGTLMLPTFSFDFSNKKYYDIVKTKGTTGALGNIALERPDFQRTQHPMHSFEVWGNDMERLVSMSNKHSFGVDSPFAYCVGSHVKQVILGTDYVHAMTFIHYAEVTCNVPYRFAKSFTGTYVDEHGISTQRTYDYAARKLEIEPKEEFNRMGRILEEKGVSRKIDIYGLTCYIIDLAGSYPVICKDIIENKCANIYDFNIPRDHIFG